MSNLVRSSILPPLRSATATPKTPATPMTPATPQTGTWRHPKLDEIIKRRDASTFSERNVKSILWNITGLAVLWFIGRLLFNTFPSLFHTDKAFQPYSSYLFHVCQIVLVYNVFVACVPLFRTRDEITDIALTPAQRKLLGLPPSFAPPTPGSNYITPPRYARTPTSMSGSPGSREKFTDSPLAKKGSANSDSVSGSPFSPGASPLLQKAVGGGLNGNRRHSYGSASPLGPSASRTKLPETPGTPSPSTAKGTNVGLNSKWLYDKGRRNSGNVRLFS